MASRVEERNQKRLRELLKRPENKKCFDCTEKGPFYVCTTLNTFVCTVCSGIHREFGHRVKSISMAKFDEEEIRNLEQGANDVARKKWLATWTPDQFREPDSSQTEEVREFMRRKYQQKLWVAREGRGRSDDNEHHQRSGTKKRSNTPPPEPLTKILGPNIPTLNVGDPRGAPPAGPRTDDLIFGPAPTPAPAPAPAHPPPNHGIFDPFAPAHPAPAPAPAPAPMPGPVYGENPMARLQAQVSEAYKHQAVAAQQHQVQQMIAQQQAMQQLQIIQAQLQQLAMAMASPAFGALPPLQQQQYVMQQQQLMQQQQQLLAIVTGGSVPGLMGAPAPSPFASAMAAVAPPGGGGGGGGVAPAPAAPTPVPVTPAPALAPTPTAPKNDGLFADLSPIGKAGGAAPRAPSGPPIGSFGGNGMGGGGFGGTSDPFASVRAPVMDKAAPPPANGGSNNANDWFL